MMLPESHQLEPEPKHARTRAMASMLTERLPEAVLELLKQIGSAADEMSCNAYAVGGFVRDVFLRVVNS